MINIFTENGEITTYTICKWLEHYNAEYKLIYPDYEDYEISINNSKKIIQDNKSVFHFDENDCYWYRRGEFRLGVEKNIKEIFNLNIKNDALNEIHALKSTLYHLVNCGNNFSSIENAELNRLFTLITADKFGIKVPNYLATNSKLNLLDFFQEYKKIVLKPFGNGLCYSEGNVLYSTFTNIFSKKEFNKLPNKFFPSLFLEYIDKKYEVRTFYLAGKFYSMAIMSQFNKKTKFDFRHYDLNFPNRYAPYKLPSGIVSKLKKLIKYFKLNTCSIDLIVNKCGEYVFLEINPVGQFTFVGYPCNYYLERAFAKALIIKTKMNEK